MTNTTTTPRVAMFINSLQRGGAETQFLRVARALSATGAEVRIFTVLGDNDFTDQLGELPVHLLSARPGPATVAAAVRQLRAWRPDVVLSFLYQATIVGRIAAKAARTPVVISSMRNERLESRARTALYRATGMLDTTTITNSVRAAVVLEAERTVRRGALRVIPNGLDLALFAPVPPPAPPTSASVRVELGLSDDVVLFLGMGRLAPQKDWPTLISAVELYTGPPAHWAIAGDGPDAADLREQIAAAGLADRITLLGLRDDAVALLAACDVLVLSSTYEGLPNVVLEAMAARRPVVATRVGGCPELVLPDFGLLVAPRRPAELATAMAELACAGHAERAVMGTAARDHVHEFYSLDVANRRWVELVDELLGQVSVSRVGSSVQESRTRGAGSSGMDEQ